MVAAAPVFADVDTGVDDAIALIYLLASPDAELVGIASSGGNVGVEQVCENNLGLLELCRGRRRAGIQGQAAHPLNSPSPLSATAQSMGHADWAMPSCRRPIGNSAAMTPHRRGSAPPVSIPGS